MSNGYGVCSSMIKIIRTSPARSGTSERVPDKSPRWQLSSVAGARAGAGWSRFGRLVRDGITEPESSRRMMQSRDSGSRLLAAHVPYDAFEEWMKCRVNAVTAADRRNWLGFIAFLGNWP